MRQIVSLIFFNALLSIVLFWIAGIVLVRLIPAGRLLFDSNLRHKEYRTLKAKYGDPLGGMQRVLWLLEFVCLPIIAVMIGAITGMKVKAEPIPIALLGIVPIEVFVLSFSRFRVRDVLPHVAYSALACLSAFAIFHLRTVSP